MSLLDLLQMTPSKSSEEDSRRKIQHAIDCWEGDLSATSGAIVPEKTFWYLIDFHWQAGGLRYKSISECPGSLAVHDIQGQRKILSQVEVAEAKETLGIFLAPNGGMQGEFHKLKAAVNDWVEQMIQGKLNRSEVWITLQSTSWSTLSYPLQAINLGKTQWETIMAVLLNYVLPVMDTCRHFPRAIVFAPDKSLGLGIQHLYTMQEITRARDFIYSKFESSITGHLYESSLEVMLVEIGILKPLAHLSYEKIGILATNSLLKALGRSWKCIIFNFIQETLAHYPI